MDVTLDRIEWADGEAYRVTIIADQERAEGRLLAGHAWRPSGADQWLFGHADEFDPTDKNAIHFDAVDRDAVRVEMIKRFRVVELPRDRLDDSRMVDVTSGILNMLASLARVTKSDQGFVNALISALARYAVIDIKQDRQGAFVDLVCTSLTQRVAEMRAILAERDEPTKH